MKWLARCINGEAWGELGVDEEIKLNVGKCNFAFCPLLTSRCISCGPAGSDKTCRSACMSFGESAFLPVEFEVANVTLFKFSVELDLMITGFVRQPLKLIFYCFVRVCYYTKI